MSTSMSMTSGIVFVFWPPWMTLLPHNHLMWAVIGVYTGREDNVFWRRIRDRRDGKVEAASARALCVGDAEPHHQHVVERALRCRAE